MFEILYYVNGHGGTAASVDGGEYVVVKTGNMVPQAGTPWEECDEEDCGPFSSEQQALVDRACAKEASRTEEESGLNDVVLAYRKRRLGVAERGPKPEPEKRERALSPSVMVEYSDD